MRDVWYQLLQMVIKVQGYVVSVSSIIGYDLSTRYISHALMYFWQEIKSPSWGFLTNK